MRTTEGRTFRLRIKRLRESLEERGLVGGIVVPGPNSRYLTGVSSLLLERPFLFLIPVHGKIQIVAPRLEAGPYTSSPLDIDIHDWTDSQGSDGATGDAIREVNLRGKWGVEGRTPFLFLSKLIKHASPEFQDAEPIFQSVREVKDVEEMSRLRKAASILSKSFEEFPELIKEGMTELELGRKATEIIYANGATRVEDVLVQSGIRCADPHALPSSKRIRRGEGIILDISSTFDGYFADITRTLCVGSSQELRKVYSEVLDAEELGVKAGGEGVKAGQVDAAARERLARAGLGKYFIHRTGHGLGLEVHEGPYIIEGGEEELKNGMCYTVEPGAYLRGKLGVRIEDDVLLEKGRAVQITTPPKEFGWWE
jgi:Xaa-Pro aminopeptidase